MVSATYLHVQPLISCASVLLHSVRSIQLRPLVLLNVGTSESTFIMRRSLVIMYSSIALPLMFVCVSDQILLLALLSRASKVQYSHLLSSKIH